MHILYVGAVSQGWEHWGEYRSFNTYQEDTSLLPFSHCHSYTVYSQLEETSSSGKSMPDPDMLNDPLNISSLNPEPDPLYSEFPEPEPDGEAVRKEKEIYSYTL